MIIAGEASGDLHGGNVLIELRKLRPELEMVGTGGKLLESAGLKCFYNVEEMAVIGFQEVLKRHGCYWCNYGYIICINHLSTKINWVSTAI